MKTQMMQLRMETDAVDLLRAQLPRTFDGRMQFAGRLVSRLIREDAIRREERERHAAPAAGTGIEAGSNRA